MRARDVSDPISSSGTNIAVSALTSMFSMSSSALAVIRADDSTYGQGFNGVFVFDTARLQGTFDGSGISGNFGGARSTIGNIPLLISGADGRWRYYNEELTVNGAGELDIAGE